MNELYPLKGRISFFSSPVFLFPLKKLVLIFIAVLFVNTLFSQKAYKAMMDDFSINFYDVCAEAEQYFETHDKGKGSGWKGYQRWKHGNEYKYYPSGRRDNVDPFFPEHAFSNYLKANPEQADVKSLFPNGWNDLGPYRVDNITGGYSAGLGRVEDLYVDPTDANHIKKWRFLENNRWGHYMAAYNRFFACKWC